MKNFTNLLVLSVFALGISNLAIADSDDAEEFQALNSSSLTLSDAIARAEAETNARAISAELEKEHKSYVFEVELVTAEGNEMEVNIDAATGELTKSEEDDEGNWFTRLF